MHGRTLGPALLRPNVPIGACFALRLPVVRSRGADMNQGLPIVFIGDDDEAVRNSLRLLGQVGWPDCHGIGLSQEFLASYDPLQPGCLVLDVRMPGMKRPRAATAIEPGRRCRSFGNFHHRGMVMFPWP